MYIFSQYSENNITYELISVIYDNDDLKQNYKNVIDTNNIPNVSIKFINLKKLSDFITLDYIKKHIATLTITSKNKISIYDPFVGLIVLIPNTYSAYYSLKFINNPFSLDYFLNISNLFF